MRRSRVSALVSGGWFGLIRRVDWSPVFAFLIGLLSGFLSIAAGAAVTVVIPVLLALGLSADAANATSRFSLALAGLLAAVAFVRQHTVDWKATVPLLFAAAAGTVAGSFVGVRIPSPDMLTIIVITSAVSLGLVFLRPDRWLAATPQRPVMPPRFAAALFFLLCLYEGVVAVDSALLRLIALVYLLGYPIAVANPTKVITGLVMLGVSSLIYGRAGQIDWGTATPLTIGTLIGAAAAIPLACSVKAQRGIYRLLQVVVTMETVWLIFHWLRVQKIL